MKNGVQNRNSPKPLPKFIRKAVREKAKLDDLSDVISDHAVLRYLQYVMGVDPIKVRQAILQGRENTIRTMLDGAKLKTKVGGMEIRLVIKGGKVVTLHPPSVKS